MMEKIEKLISFEGVQDAAERLFVVTGIIYLLLFCAESILPGMVIEVFNINILLFFLIVAVGYFAWLENNKLRSNQKLQLGKMISYSVVVVLMPIAVVTLFIVQYKIGIIESVFYIALSFLITKLFYHMIN